MLIRQDGKVLIRFYTVHAERKIRPTQNTDNHVSFGGPEISEEVTQL